MSLTDKVIEELLDETYAGGLVDRDEAEEYADDFRRLAAVADQPFGAQMMVASAVAAEVLAAALMMFGMRYLLRIFGDVYIAVFGTLFVFFTGFFGAYAAYKLYKEYVAPVDDPTVHDGVMSGFSEYDSGQSGITIYVVSAASGIINVAIFIGLAIFKFG
jgi:hypothetical protein